MPPPNCPKRQADRGGGGWLQEPTASKSDLSHGVFKAEWDSFCESIPESGASSTGYAICNQTASCWTLLCMIAHDNRCISKAKLSDSEDPWM